MDTSKQMLSSPIKWVGGKSKSRADIIGLLPAGAECYCEVFAGAAWVLFGKPSHPVEVLNDKNGDLVNLWRVLKHRPAELLERVHQSLYSREQFMVLREMRPGRRLPRRSDCPPKPTRENRRKGDAHDTSD